jgi:hypothetical protein
VIPWFQILLSNGSTCTAYPAVHAVAVAILPVIALYQMADGIRVVGLHTFS